MSRSRSRSRVAGRVERLSSPPRAHALKDPAAGFQVKWRHKAWHGTVGR